MMTDKGKNKYLHETAEDLHTYWDEKTQVNAILTKILDDIDFLNHRIKHLENSSNPNQIMLKTYKDMLTNRESALAWMEKNDVVCSIPPHADQTEEKPKSD